MTEMLAARSRVTLRLPDDLSVPLVAPDYVALSTPRADRSPRNRVVWAALEDDLIPTCRSDAVWKAKDTRRDPRVGLSDSNLSKRFVRHPG